MLTPNDVTVMQDVVKSVYIDYQVKQYILDLVRSTRDPAAFGMDDLAPLVEYGASPRATIYLGMGARAVAFLQGRGYVTPQDVKDIAYDVLRHRVILTYEAEAEENDHGNPDPVDSDHGAGAVAGVRRVKRIVNLSGACVNLSEARNLA